MPSRCTLLLTILCLLAFSTSRVAFAQESEPNTSPGEQTQAPKDSHNGGIRDVDAIGNRNVGCGRGVGNWYSLEKQVAMGKSYAQQVDSSSKLIKDPVVTEYVNRLGQNLVRNSDAKVPFTIKVIDSEDINAFALPGGFFYVNSGLILAADDEAELAGVMAHEIGHVAACHVAREQTRGTLAGLATIPLIFVGGGVGYAAAQAANLAVPVTFMRFSRGFESQADYLGVEYMYKAGYDPQAFLSFFEKIEAKEKKKPGTIAKVFETHPPTPERMKAAQEEIASILPSRPQYILNTSEFDDVKARLAAIENGHKMKGEEDSKHPTLRRAQGKPNNPDDADAGDQRPTLKRREDQAQPESTGS
jgi:predicted Zn-dependent protease